MGQNLEHTIEYDIQHHGNLAIVTGAASGIAKGHADDLPNKAARVFIVESPPPRRTKQVKH